jgi:DNA polymerase III subunit delta
VIAVSPTKQSVKSLKPRPHFKREPVFLAHCKRWGAARLARTLPLIQEAVRRTRRSPELEGAFAERLVLTITSRI